MYPFLRPLLFIFDAERSHALVLSALRLAYCIPGLGFLVRSMLGRRVPVLPVSVMGRQFPNPVGLAAGLDKDAQCIRPFLDMGFGWVEVGTVTPRPQPGNPGRRLFRVPQAHALINRLGFNSVGVEAFTKHLRRAGKPGIIGVNIGRNKDTPSTRATEDYVQALRAVYAHADYVALNVSSPNTPGLRDLQERQQLDTMLLRLKHEQALLTEAHGMYVPLALKIAPDIDEAQIANIAELVLAHRLDAVIATNTTLGRAGIEHLLVAREAGGLSGRPLKEPATTVIRGLYAHLQGKVPIIGVGGIESADDAWDKLVAGADLVQIYTALVYEGPALVRRIVSGLARRVRESGRETLAEAVAKARSNSVAQKARSSQRSP